VNRLLRDRDAMLDANHALHRHDERIDWRRTRLECSTHRVVFSAETCVHAPIAMSMSNEKIERLLRRKKRPQICLCIKVSGGFCDLVSYRSTVANT
jgi:hypothetical protein